MFAKSAFKTNKSVIEYLGRYTHKIAISNYRILNIDKENRTVAFSLKDYRKKGKKTTQTLTTREFIRRFSMHILPRGFTRIRHFGILSSAWKKDKLPALQQLLSGKKQEVKSTDVEGVKKVETKLNRCPACKKGKLVTLMVFDKRGPPPDWKQTIKKLSLQLWINHLQKLVPIAIGTNRTVIAYTSTSSAQVLWVLINQTMNMT